MVGGHMGALYQPAEFVIIFGKGICKVGNILDVAVNLDIVKKAGSWFSFREEKLGQGRDKARDFLTENPDILKEVETLVREKLAAPNQPAEEVAE